MTNLLNTYNFMDLLKEKGQVPTQEEMSILFEIENSINEFSEFMEETTTDYNFLNLLQDKGYGRKMAFVASNDNGLITLQAS